MANHEHDKLAADVEKSFAQSTRRGRLRAALKKNRRNLEPKPPRKKDWELRSTDDWDDVEYQPNERIMPIDEGDRRRSLEQAAFKDAGPQSEPAEKQEQAIQGRPGTVVSVSSGSCTVVRDGARLQCRIRSALTAEETPFTNAVAVGDEVTFSDDGSGGATVVQVLRRRKVLARPDVFHSHRRQIIVSNADQVLIVGSWREPNFWPELVDRCIIAAQRAGLLPIICVNKTDLMEDAAELKEALKPYQALEHRVVKTSVVSGNGIDELRAVLHDKTTALTGLSGAGKSSLISAVEPGLHLRTSEVTESRKLKGQGRHTTTQVTMLALEEGGFVVDTPGIREFGLSGLRRHELAEFFPEISALASGCRFNNCAHLEEPGCAVQAGRVPETRYHSYRSILDTLPE